VRFVYGRPVHVGYERGVNAALPYTLGRHHSPWLVGYERGVDAYRPYTLGTHHVGALLPKSGSDVIQLENQYDPDFQNTNAGWDERADSYPRDQASGMYSWPANFTVDYGAWKKFLITWNAMMNDPVKGGTFSADDEYDAVVTYTKQLQGWQQKLRSYGGRIPGPPIVPPTPTGNQGPSWQAVAWPVALGLGAVAAAMIFRK
jgi:hypothetical protein